MWSLGIRWEVLHGHGKGLTIIHTAFEGTWGLPKVCQNPGSIVLTSSLLVTFEAVAGKVENRCTEN